MRSALIATVALALAATVSGISQVEAQGIDCRRPPTAAEVTVCRDPGLMELDDRLARNYFRFRDQLRGPDLYRLEQEQAVWREVRRRCIYDVRCLYGVYQRRIDELREYRQDSRDYRPGRRDEYRRY